MAVESDLPLILNGPLLVATHSANAAFEQSVGIARLDHRAGKVGVDHDPRDLITVHALHRIHGELSGGRRDGLMRSTGLSRHQDARISRFAHVEFQLGTPAAARHEKGAREQERMSK
jgi:hypothetical protein